MELLPVKKSDNEENFQDTQKGEIEIGIRQPKKWQLQYSAAVIGK